MSHDTSLIDRLNPLTFFTAEEKKMLYMMSQEDKNIHEMIVTALDSGDEEEVKAIRKHFIAYMAKQAIEMQDELESEMKTLFKDAEKASQEEEAKTLEDISSL